MRESIFISYKRVDKERVFKLKDLIEYETKEKCWIDLDGIESDDQFGLVIANAIEKADIFLFMYSRAHSEIIDYENDWTIREINYAQAEKKRIVFVNIDGTPLTKWFKLIFGLKQQVDATSGTAVKKLIQDLKKWLAEPVQENEIDTSAKEVISPETKATLYDDDFETAEVLFEAKDYNDAILYYLASAERGNKTSQRKLCQFFYDNRQLIDDTSDDIWQKVNELTKKGESYAYFIMHCRYYDSNEKGLSFDLVKKATLSKDIPLAFLRLGIHYGWGVGTKQNHILAMHNYMKAYDMGCKEACSYIGGEYKYGSQKTPKNVDKAVEYYKRGAELGDKRSMSSLAKMYYHELNKADDAKAVAHKMIQNGIYRGYILLGDFCSTNPDYYYNYDNINEAKKWYREALLHDEYEAYSSLANIYWFVESNYKEAYSLAYKGYQKHDSSSISSLGFFYCQDGELEKSWSFFKEGYDRYGGNTQQLGSLFFDYNYRKEDKDEETLLEKELDSVLTSGAHNGDIGSLKYLIRLHSIQEFGKDSYDYETFKESSIIQQDIKLGAELNFPEMMLFYGRLLLEEAFIGYNPAKGASLIFKSAIEEGYKDAIQFLLDYKKNGIDRDDIDLDKVFTSAIKQKFVEDENLDELLQYGENNKDITEEFHEYLNYILNEKNIKMKQTLKALNILLNKKQKGEISINDDEILKYRNMMDDERSKGNLGYLSLIKSNLHSLYKEYDEDNIFKNYGSSNDTQRQLFYAANYANDEEIDTNLQDNFLEKLHSLLRFDDSLTLDANSLNSDIKDLMQAMTNYQSSYIAICKKRGITPLEYYLPKAEYQFPYMPTSVCSKISFETFNLFLTLRDIMPEIYDPMLPILKSDEQMLNYIETISSDQDLQLFLIELVEIRIDIESIMLNNWGLYKNFKENNKKPIVEYLNNILEKYGDKVSSKEAVYSLDNLPDISEITPNRTIDLNDIFEYEKTIVSTNDNKKQEEDDEFERLLNEFINSSSKEENSQH